MYLSVLRYGGMDWHDCHSISEQLMFNRRFEIPEEEKDNVIIDFIYSHFRLGITKDELKDKYIDFLNTKKSEEIPILEDDGSLPNKYNGNGYISYEQSISFMERKDTIIAINESYYFGQFDFTISFYEDEIEDPCYIVYENFLAPTKGVDSVERMYVDLFEDFYEAKKYYKSMQLHSSNRTNMGIIKEIRVTSKKEIQKKDWYKLNMKAIKLMEDTNQNPFSKSFEIFVESHIKSLEKILTT